MSSSSPTRPKSQEPPIAVLLGLPFHDVTLDEALEECRQALGQDKPGYFVTANVDFAAQAYRSPALRTIFFYADRIFCDGMPLVWISRLLGHPLRERVAGADLVPRLLKICAQEKKRVYFFGSDEQTLGEVVNILNKRLPELTVCGHESPPIGSVDDWDNTAVIERMRQSQADLVLLALGCPKQEQWIHRFHAQTGAALCIGIGASLDFISGKQKRAPKWMQKTGMEWFWRMITSPRRLIGRYSRDFFFLGAAALAQAWSLRRQTTTRHHHDASQSETAANYQTLKWEGSVERATIASVPVPDTLDAPLLLDGRGVNFIDSAGLGLLAKLTRLARQSDQPFALLQPSAALSSALKAVRMDTLVTVVPSSEVFEQTLHSAVSAPEIKNDGSTLILRLTGSLEGAALEPTQERIKHLLLIYPQVQELILDMSEVDFLDSRGIGVLLRIRRLLYQRSGEIHLKNLQPDVRDLLTLLKIDTVLHTTPNKEVHH